jgi:hypothetical protein
MKIIKMMCGLGVMSLMAWGQDTPPKEAQKMIRLKYVDAVTIRNLLSSYAAPKHVGQWTVVINVQADNSLRTLVVSGPEDMVAAYEEAVKKLDVAPFDFDLTVYLISSAPSDLLPPALAPTAKQLHGVFSYSGYQLLNSFVLRGTDGQKGAASGAIATNGKASEYWFRYEKAEVSGESAKSVSLHKLELTMRFPAGARKDGEPLVKETGLSSDIDIRDGQKVVVGKSDVYSGESPLILVVTAKVLE